MQYSEPIGIELITRENACERVTVGSDFTSDWMKNWRYCFEPISKRSKCKTNYFSKLKWQPRSQGLGTRLFKWQPL